MTSIIGFIFVQGYRVANSKAVGVNIFNILFVLDCGTRERFTYLFLIKRGSLAICLVLCELVVSMKC